MIRTENVTFEYIRRDEEGNVEGITRALDDVSVHIRDRHIFRHLLIIQSLL